jgi:EF-P beta-lysylation protein EpmB
MSPKVNRASFEIAAHVAPTDTTMSWQAELRNAYTDIAELLRDLGLSESAHSLAVARDVPFRFRVTRNFARRMRPGNPQDPLLLQVLPQHLELIEREGFLSDPVDDDGAQCSPGLLHKYHGRALLIMTGGCAIHCRYCFRREYPYQESVGPERLEMALAHIASDATLSEVLLSGGDPLLLSDRALRDVIDRLGAIPHIRRVRIHTRLPVVLPTRITPALITALTQGHLRIVMVLHSNHAQELDESVAAACQTLRHAGVTLLNQSVLLRGINDDVDTLAALSERLFELGVLPYYLHLLDRVRGAAHFEVDDDRARQLQTSLRARLPGYLLPRFVREIAREPYKVPLDHYS